MAKQLKEAASGLRYAGRFPEYRLFVMLPDEFSEIEIDAFVQKLKEASTKGKREKGLVTYKDDQLKTPRIGETALSLRFKYDWKAKTGDYNYFFRKTGGGGKSEDPAFLKSIEEVQDILFKQGSGLEVQIFRFGLIDERIRVPVSIKTQPGYKEALAFAALAPIWTLFLDPLSKMIDDQAKTQKVEFPRALMKDRELLPWGDGFSEEEALTKAILDYVDVLSSIEARSIADRSFDKLFQAKSMCIAFQEKTRQVIDYLKLKNLPILSKLSHKILELDQDGMTCLHATLATVELKIDKIIEELELRM